MSSKAEKVSQLARALAQLLCQENQAWSRLLNDIEANLRSLQSETADRRMNVVLEQVRQLERKLRPLSDCCKTGFLDRIEGLASEIESAEVEESFGRIVQSLLPQEPRSSTRFCEELVNQLAATCGAQRALLVFYLPETTEAEVVAAKSFQTRNLSVEEYSFSRTILQTAFSTGEVVSVSDACSDPLYDCEESVQALSLRSVLAVPLRDGERILGALYLENSSIPDAFNGHQFLVACVARFAAFYLRHARLFPDNGQPRRNPVLLNPEMISREMIGHSQVMASLIDLIARAAKSDATVLILGETGTGKELVARALHYQSSRCNAPFVALSCACLPEELAESELFGHEKGSFTGAIDRRMGVIEQANNGTLFLDEIGEMPQRLQAKLLRFLQTGQIRRIGGQQTIDVKVRIVAATSRDLNAMVSQGSFHEALFFRLNVIPLTVPPLRARAEDIPLLIDHFVPRFSAAEGKHVVVMPEVYDALRECEFPGNVRELENLLRRLVALSADERIRLGDLPDNILNRSRPRVSLQKDPLARILREPPRTLNQVRERRKAIQEILQNEERQLLETAVQEAGGNITKAARLLGINRVNLHQKLRAGGGTQSAPAPSNNVRGDGAVDFD